MKLEVNFFIVLNLLITMGIAAVVYLFIVRNMNQTISKNTKLIVMIVVMVFSYVLIDMNGKTLYIISKDFRVNEYRVIGSPKLTFANKSIEVDIRFDEVGVFNQSESELLLAPVFYGEEKSIKKSNDDVYIIEPLSFTSQFLVRKKIDYFFDEGIKNKIYSIHESDIKYHLQKN